MRIVRAKAAARTLLAGPGHVDSYDEVPYFWSDQYDVKLQMIGLPGDYDSLEFIERAISTSGSS